MSNIRSFFKHSSIYAVGNIINRLGAFVLLPIYTNYLTVGEYGAIELFYVISSFASGVLAIGLAHSTLRFYYEYDEEIERRHVVSTNYIGSLLITITGALIISTYAGELTDNVIKNDEYSIGIYIILATMVLELSTQICLAYLRAIEYSMFFVIISFVKLIIQVALNSYLVVVHEAGVIGVLFGNLVTVAIGWLILTVFTLRRCGFVFHIKKFIPVVKYSFPFLLSTILGLISTNVDKIIITNFIALQALGIYALALKFSQILEFVIGEPFARSYGAFRFSIMNNKDAPEIQSKIVSYLYLISTFMIISISYFANDLLLLISKPEFWPASEFVPLLLIASLIKLMTYPLQSGILFAKKTKYLFYFTVVTAFVSVISNYFLIKSFNLYGACMALILIELVSLTMTNHVSQKFFYVKYDHKKLIIITLLFALFMMPILYINDVQSILMLITKLFLLMLYPLSLYLFKIITNEELIQIKHMFIKRVN